MSTTNHDINVTALVKGNERYVWFWRDANRREMFASLSRFAANPELSFTWYDAAIVAQKIREAENKHGSAESR